MADFKKKRGEIVRAEENDPTITMYGVVDEQKITAEMNADISPKEAKKTYLRSVINLGATLGIIALIVGALLAGVNALTADRITEFAAAKKASAMQSALPDAEKFEAVSFEKTKLVSEIQRATKGGESVGYAVTATPNGFGGTIEIIVGVSNEGKVTGISIVSMSETAGLGSRAGEEGFRSQYAGKEAGMSVVKSGAAENQINAISGATITSEAVTAGVNAALEAVNNLNLGGE